MSVYYNEIDPYAAQWLRNLISAGHLPAGDVDERSIEDVTPNDLRGYTQCHFFAGIGGWAYALALAGWPASRPVWTGSCPCQPFSAAGKGAGFADQRHLWPAWFHLIRECRPAEVFGEQVASKAADDWIDLVQADLEGVAYAFGCIPFPAAGIGSPHIRDRNYWCAVDRLGVGQADANYPRLEGWEGAGERAVERTAGPRGMAGGVADANCGQRERIAILRGHERDGQDAGWPQGVGSVAAHCEHVGLADSDQQRCAGQHALLRAEAGGRFPSNLLEATGCSPTSGHWRDADWLLCRDGKWRPVEPGTFPLAHGLPARVGRLRGYGNAIVPQQAAEFIAAYMEVAGFSAMPEAA